MHGQWLLTDGNWRLISGFLATGLRRIITMERIHSISLEIRAIWDTRK